MGPARPLKVAPAPQPLQRYRRSPACPMIPAAASRWGNPLSRASPLPMLRCSPALRSAPPGSPRSHRPVVAGRLPRLLLLPRARTLRTQRRARATPHSMVPQLPPPHFRSQHRCHRRHHHRSRRQGPPVEVHRPQPLPIKLRHARRRTSRESKGRALTEARSAGRCCRPMLELWQRHSRELAPCQSWPTRLAVRAPPSSQSAPPPRSQGRSHPRHDGHCRAAQDHRAPRPSTQACIGYDDTRL